MFWFYCRRRDSDRVTRQRPYPSRASAVRACSDGSLTSASTKRGSRLFSASGTTIARMRAIVVPEAENSRDPRFVLADVKLPSLQALTAEALLG